MAEQDNDRRRTQDIKGKQVNFIFLPPDTLPPIEKVTSVAVVPFTGNGEIVAALLHRGPDIPGGHMHKGETSFEETARREAMEEAFITLGPLKTALVIQSDFYGSAPEELTYMLVMTGIVTEFHDVIPDGETLGRKVMPVSDFLAAYTAGDPHFMAEIIEAARDVQSAKPPRRKPGSSL
ncbi:MAG TPA: NUDIX domain-containing protein [Patescibacteria group bacterium]|nr:NUDIX domain-containing protein [Patescibacteria group bacterium]